MANWIREAEHALGAAGAPSVHSSAEVVEKHAPALIDANGARALVAPFLAGFMWAALVFRETQIHSTLEPLALLLRLLAYALTLRAVRLLWVLAGRIRLALQRSRFGLVLTREGLFLRAPDRDVVVPQEDILEIREQAATALGSRATQRWADVYLITRPETGRVYLALPPIFGHSPRALAEQLMRWRHGAPDPAPPVDVTKDELPNRLWDRAAQGEAIADVVAIAHGQRWLARGPYASMLLGLAVLDGYVRLPAQARDQLEPGPALMLASALVIVPAAWAFFTRARLRSRRGLSLVLTPGALLVRAARGSAIRLPWSDITRVEVHSRNSWSLLRGAFDARTLLVHRKQEISAQLTEDFLALPIDVVAGLCEVYRKRAVVAETGIST
jgi:hypothetical protein